MQDSQCHSENEKIYEANQDLLAGAGKVLADGIINLTNFTDCTIAQAIKAATVNPACVLQLEDRGVISSGKRADLILYKTSGAYLELVQTFVAGKRGFEA